MPASETFATKLKMSYTAIDHAIDYLKDAQLHSKEALPEPKHRRLLNNTITNLRRRRRIILALIDATINAAYPTPSLPGFPTPSPHTDVTTGKTQSPHKAEPARPE